MNKYELVILINDSLSITQKEETIKQIEKFIKANGQLENTKILGSKKLAYEIRKNKTAYYCLFYFNITSTLISELERLCRINEDILKFMTLRADY